MRLRAASLEDIARLRRSIEQVGRISDGLVRLGRFGLGLDGLLAWVPGLGAAYSLLAGGYLLLQGWRARAPLGVLLAGLALMSARSLIAALGEALPPFLPLELIVDFFLAHRWTAERLARAIDETRYLLAPADPSHSVYAAALADQASGRDRRRIVALG